MKQLLNVVKKNFKRIIQSKTSSGAIFFGPFIILLLISGAYTSSQTLRLNIGFISDSSSDFVDGFVETLQEGDFDVVRYGTIDRCIENLKLDHVSVCVNVVTKAEKPELILYADYSKLTFIDMVISSLTKRVNIQSNELRTALMNELVISMRDASDMIIGLEGTFDEMLYGPDSPTKSLSNIQDQIDSTQGAIISVRTSLDGFEEMLIENYQENSKSLNDVESQVIDVQNRAVSQRNTLQRIQNYNYDCEDTYLEEIINNEELLMDMSDYERRELFQEYGKCKCVDFYRPNLESIEDDLDQVIDYTSDVRSDIYSSKSRNQNSFQETMGLIQTQENNVGAFENQKSTLSRSMMLLEDNMNSKLKSIRLSLSEFRNSNEYLSNSSLLSSEKFVSPVKFSVKPIAAERSLMVYVFPPVYFFILMFISLIFSSTFTFSEKRSSARQRNLLSPLSKGVGFAGTFITMLIISILQGLLIIFLANTFFSLSLSGQMFANIIFATALVSSFFILLGMFIGWALRSQLLVMLTSIGLTIVMFLYSSIINPVEVMNEASKLVVSINPFSIGTQVMSKMMLFDMNLVPFLESLSTIFFEMLLLLVVFVIAYNMSDEN